MTYALKLRIQNHQQVEKLLKKAGAIYEDDGRFKYVSKEPVDFPEKIKAKLLSVYGLRKVLIGRRRYFKFKEFKITVNIIDDMGEFLILTGENPTKRYIEEVLKIPNPEYATTSFDEL